MPVAPSAPSRINRRCYAKDLFVLAIIGLLYFSLLGVRPLSNPDEGRYAEIPREMVATGDYVTPRLDGMKYFEKPPLGYWVSAAAFHVFGVNEWSVRLGSALFGYLGILAAYGAARALFGREEGLLAAVILSLSLLYFGIGQTAVLDMLVSFWISAALFAFIVAIRTEPGRKRRALFAAFYASMALGLLTKGLIAVVLPVAVIMGWMTFCGKWRALKPFHPTVGLWVFLGLAAPWHVAVAILNHDFLWFYFVHEHFERYTTQAHGRFEPWWFFLPVFLGGLFPFAVFLPNALKFSLGGSRRSASASAGWFFVLWIVLIVGFFSCSQSKLVTYILPVFPAAAVLIARPLAKRWRDHAEDGSRTGFVVYAGLSVALAAAAVFAKIHHAEAYGPELPVMRGLVAATLLLGAVAVTISARVGGFRKGLIAMAASGTVFLLVAIPIAGRLDYRSTRGLAEELKPVLSADDHVFVYREYFQDFPVYLGQTVSVVDYDGELSFGIRSEPDKATRQFMNRQEFLAKWSGPARQYVLLRKRDLASLTAGAPLDFAKVAETDDAVLLVNNRNVLTGFGAKDRPLSAKKGGRSY